MAHETAPRVGGWHHVSLSVRDLEASIEWYRRVLGFEVAFEEPAASGRRASVLAFPDGSLALGLSQHGEGGALFDPTTTGLDHAAFRVDSEEELHRWASHLDGHGVEHSGAIEIPPGGILNFKDPDGIALALFWDRRD
jgi:catechol 2,3-dioxygenase-like lactoylglutathione lyase family enzyme